MADPRRTPDPPEPDRATEELVAYLDGELDPRAAEAVATLNERQRVAVVLNKFEDMNYAEIAEVMGLTTKAVKSLLSRARTNLRAALSAYVYMDGQPPHEPEAEADE